MRLFYLFIVILHNDLFHCFVKLFIFSQRRLYLMLLFFYSVQFTKISMSQFSSVTQSCPTLCDPMDCSMQVFPVHHHFPEFSQTHVHEVSDAIQTSYPLSSPSPPTFNLSQYQGLFQSVSSSLR